MSFRKQALLLFMVVLLASALRLWNYGYDPLHGGQPRSGDVSKKISMSMRVARGDFRPRNYNHPYYLGYSTGLFLKMLPGTIKIDTPSVWRISALLMIGYSLLTVGVTYLLGKAVFGRSETALFSALLLSVVPLNVIGSRYFKEDIPLMFFLNLAVLMLVLTLRSSRRWVYLPAGIAVGLALSVKYVAAILVPFYMLCHGVRVWRTPSALKKKTVIDPYFFLGLLAVPAVFLLVNPYVIIEWKDFISTFHFQQSYAVTGHHDGTVIRGRDYWWTFYLIRAVVPGLSLPVTLAALAGILLALRKRNVEAAFVMFWVGTFYFMIESSPAKPFPFFARYIHGLAPALCMFAAYALYSLYAAAAGHRRLMSMTVLVLFFCVGTPLARSALINVSLKEDTREAAAAWINEHLEEGATICVDHKHYAARPSPDKFNVLYRSPLSLGALRRWKVDYVVVGSFSYDRFNYGKKNHERAERALLYYQNLSAHGELVKEFSPPLRWQTYGFHNPVVRIYDVRGLSPDS